MKLCILALPLTLLPVGCQTPADPPSLLPRAIETQTVISTNLQPSAPPVPDVTFTAKVDKIFSAAKAGDAEFSVARDNGAIALKNGLNAPQGSEAWIAAEMTRSALESARQKSSDALAEIDSLVVALSEQASRDTATAGLSYAIAAQSDIEGIVDRQSRQLNKFTR